MLAPGIFSVILELVVISRLNYVKMNEIILSLYGIKMKGFICTIIMNINKGDKVNFKGQLEVIKTTKHENSLIFLHFFSNITQN